MHRAESILSVLETTLGGLATTGANVARGRVWPVENSPSITIYKDSDLASENQEVLDTLVRELNFNVEIHLTAPGNPETTLNQIAAEIYAVLNVDITLGLSYVFDCALVGDSAPEIEASQDLPVARMVSAWVVLYEHSKGSAEA